MVRFAVVVVLVVVEYGGEVAGGETGEREAVVRGEDALVVGAGVWGGLRGGGEGCLRGVRGLVCVTGECVRLWWRWWSWWMSGRWWPRSRRSTAMFLWKMGECRI